MRLQWGLLSHVEQLGTFEMSVARMDDAPEQQASQGLLVAVVVLALMSLVMLQGVYNSPHVRKQTAGTAAVSTLVLTVYSMVSSQCSVAALHIHHWIIGLVVVIFSRGQRHALAFIQGVGLGVFVDGLMRYGPSGMCS